MGELHMILVNKIGRIDLPLDNGIRAMLNGCSKLERLHIRLCRGGLTDMGLGYIGKYGHNLKYLFLGNIGESNASGLVELSKGCPKLRKLEMSCAFNKQSAAAIVFKMRSLRFANSFRVVVFSPFPYKFAASAFLCDQFGVFLDPSSCGK
ncbi:nucleosome assembly protein 1,4 [Tanacetum coccineum]